MALWHLIVHEISSHIRRTRVQILVLATAVLAVAAVVVGIGDYRMRLAGYQQAVGVRAAERQKNNIFLTGRFTEPALRVLRAPRVGSIFVRGVDGALPAYWDFGPAGVSAGPPGPSLRPVTGASTFLDLEELVRFVLGFLALTLALETVGQERTNGSLAALMTQPVGASVVIAGKVLAALLALAGAVIVMNVATIGTMWVEGRELLSSQVFGIVGAFSVFSLLYLGVILAGGVAISTLTRTYGAAVNIGTVSWFVVVLLAPELASVASRALAPVQLAQEVEFERQTMYTGREHLTEQLLGNTAYRLLGDRAYRLDREVDKEAMAKIDDLWTAEASETRGLLDVIDDRAMREADSQDQIRGWFSLVSPATVFADLVADLSDTGATEKSQWGKDIVAHQQLLDARVFDDRATLLMLVPTRDGGPRTVMFNRHPFPRIREVPDFSTTSHSIRSRLSSCLGKLAALVAYWMALSAVAIGGFLRCCR